MEDGWELKQTTAPACPVGIGGGITLSLGTEAGGTGLREWREKVRCDLGTPGGGYTIGGERTPLACSTRGKAAQSSAIPGEERNGATARTWIWVLLGGLTTGNPE